MINKRNFVIFMVRHYPVTISFLFYLINHLPFNNRFKISNKNYMQCQLALITKSNFKIKGTGNRIEILPLTRLNNCKIHISGNNNTLYIGENVNLNEVEFWFEDNNNLIKLGNKTTCEGSTHIACIEGKHIYIGNDCMLSANIVFRVGDSHSIIDNNGIRINPSNDINIGNHVWIGNNVIILKGTTIADNSIVGTGSVVTKSFNVENSIIAGNPAKVRKGNCNWLRERILCEK